MTSGRIVFAVWGKHTSKRAVKIKHVEIGNFRKLQAVRIDFTEATTILVGANNSGKTSAMVALRRFLIDQSDFTVNDFTLTHWRTLDALGDSWESGKAQTPVFDWEDVLPFLDVWLDVPMDQIHYVQELLPTLDWDGSTIGVRLRFQPKDREQLEHDYVAARKSVAAVMSSKRSAPATPATEAGTERASGQDFSLWPGSLVEFLTRRINACFEVRAYLLDPAHLQSPTAGIAKSQRLPSEAAALDSDPFRGIIRIDEISAQRGFGFSPSSRDDIEPEAGEQRSRRRLSTQLRAYYTHHLDPLGKPEPKDLTALEALFAAQQQFGKRMEESFAGALTELEQIGYPGVTDPKLMIKPKLSFVDGLNHASAVLFQVPTHSEGGSPSHVLPEDSNGLGYQNLISIVFALMSFRDKWMKVGKAGFAPTGSELIPPLHLVLIEEPEAHLHAQVQQVFVKQAYDVLRQHPLLVQPSSLQTQLVISTHSSHIAHEADFASLRYFRRLPAPLAVGAVPVSAVVNLSEIFGPGSESDRFVRRYIKATHCDLFFADGAVLVEGPTERILLPHLVRARDEYRYLDRCYITWLEIGGSHAHRLKPLLLHLGLNTLIVTDIDAKDGTTGKKVAVLKRGIGLKTRNETLKRWLPAEESFDNLLSKRDDELVHVHDSGFSLRVAYQQPVPVHLKSLPQEEALANTFEDAFLYENLARFESTTGTGLLGSLCKHASGSQTVDELAQGIATALSDGNKAELALDLLALDEADEFNVPSYIDRGLRWLIEQLRRKQAEVVTVHQAVP